MSSQALPRMTPAQRSAQALKVEAIGAQGQLDLAFRMIAAGDFEAAVAATGEVRALVKRAIRGEKFLRAATEGL